MNILCPQCHSDDVYYSKKRAIYVCEDCEHQFLNEKQIASQKLFFSYGHDPNTELVLKLKEDLESRGHTVWLDKAQIKTGDHWRQCITEGLLESNNVLSFLSQHSVRNPGVCLDELRIALCVKGGNVKTVLLENETEVTPPASISDRQWLDMSGWRIEKDNSTNWDEWYRSKFDELCRVLESEDACSFSGDIEFLKKSLSPCLSDTKEQYLLKQQYVGRQWLYDALENWRQKSDRNSKMFVVYGAPGIGKSCFAVNLLHYNPQVLCGVFCEWDKDALNNAKSIIRTLAFKLATKIPDYRKLLVEKICSVGNQDIFSAMTDADHFDFLISLPLSQIVDGNRIKSLILIDGIDESERSGQNALAQVLMDNVDRLPNWISFVVTSRPEYSVTTLFHNFRPHTINPDGAQNNRDLFDYLKLNLALTFSEQTINDLTIKQLVQNSQGSFLYAALLIESVRLKETQLSDLKLCPVGLDSYYLQNFRRKYPDSAAYKSTRRILELIAAAQLLPIEILVASIQITPYELQEFRFAMGSLISESQISVDGATTRLKALSFCHKSIIDWLASSAKSGIYHVDIKAGAAILARYFRKSIEHNKEIGYLPDPSILIQKPSTDLDVLSHYKKTNLINFFILSNLWEELEEFLIEKDTPLYPYWSALIRFPKGWKYSILISRLWDDKTKIQFLEQQQRWGEQKYVETIMQLFVEHYGISAFDIQTLNIYIDIIHLGGNYPNAVEQCDKYLKAFKEAEILSQKDLLHLKIRKLHHSMFFAPVYPLLQEALCLESRMGKEIFPEEYNEMLFLIGGNLGCLHGDFDFAKQWIERSLEFALSHSFYDYECRSVRKLIDVLCMQGRLEEALKLALKYVTPECNIVSRYQVYLLGVLGEVYRQQRSFPQSSRCFERLEKVTIQRGLPGWQSHAYLGMAGLLVDRRNYEEASAYLENAKKIYQRLDLKWGIINSAIIGYQIELALHDRTLPDFQERINYTIAQAESLQYLYYRDFLETMKSGSTPEQFHILFL